MELTVAKIGRAHGLRGEVALDLRTDDPEQRFAVGQVLRTLPPEAGPLTVTGNRIQNGRWHVTFAELTDRTAAENARGIELVIDADASEEDDAWYPHELNGLRAELTDGTVVGTIIGLEHLPASDMLVLRETDGTRTLVPFLRVMVPVVDVPGGRVVLDPPGGLLARDSANLVVALPEGTDEPTDESADGSADADLDDQSGDETDGAAGAAGAEGDR